VNRCVNELHRNSLSGGRASPQFDFRYRVFSGYCGNSGPGPKTVKRWSGDDRICCNKRVSLRLRKTS
jgi:hypothetical protein